MCSGCFIIVLFYVPDANIVVVVVVLYGVFKMPIINFQFNVILSWKKGNGNSSAFLPHYWARSTQRCRKKNNETTNWFIFVYIEQKKIAFDYTWLWCMSIDCYMLTWNTKDDNSFCDKKFSLNKILFSINFAGIFLLFPNTSMLTVTMFANNFSAHKLIKNFLNPLKFSFPNFLCYFTNFFSNFIFSSSSM